MERNGPKTKTPPKIKHRPCRGFLFIRELPHTGNIIIPEGATVESKRGVVMARGEPAMQNGVVVDWDVEVGDTVVYVEQRTKKGDAIRLKVDGCVLLKQPNLAAVLPKQP